MGNPIEDKSGGIGYARDTWLQLVAAGRGLSKRR